MTTDKKRAQTSYGTVEYDTIQCAECTNETVTSEITHILVSEEVSDSEGFTFTVTTHPVCTGCVEETYGCETDVLDHDQLCAFYASHDAGVKRIPATAAIPEITHRSEPTLHGSVDVAVGACSRCGGEWTIDNLWGAHIPYAIVDDELHTRVCLYCPDCRELYIDAIGSDGATFLEVVESEGDVLSDAEESDEDKEVTAFKQAIVLFAGGTLVSIIFAAIHPALGGLAFLFFGSMAAYALYRHFAGLGPAPEQ